LGIPLEAHPSRHSILPGAEHHFLRTADAHRTAEAGVKLQRAYQREEICWRGQKDAFAKPSKRAPVCRKPQRAISCCCQRPNRATLSWRAKRRKASILHPLQRAVRRGNPQHA
jgi:hypothetical protein